MSNSTVCMMAVAMCFLLSLGVHAAAVTSFDEAHHATHFNHHLLQKHLGTPETPSLRHAFHPTAATVDVAAGHHVELDEPSFYMVHLHVAGKHRPHTTLRAKLRTEEVHHATTDGHAVVFASMAQLRGALDARDVRDAWLLPSSMKLHRNLQRTTSGDQSACPDPAHPRQNIVVVKFADGTKKDEVLAALKHVVKRAQSSANKNSTTQCVLRSIAVSESQSTARVALNDVCSCTPSLLNIAELNFVRWLEVAPRFHSQNNVATVTMQDPVHAKSHTIWDHHITGASQIVAVGDTGLDYDSCFFRDDSQAVTFYPQTNVKHRKVLSYKECVDDDGGHDHVDRINAHGTHVAGSATGKSLGSNAQYNGMAPDAKLFFHDLTCGSDPDGLYLPGDLYDFYVPQYETGARVGSNSWGSDSPKEYTAVDRETDRFLHKHHDYLAVFAAGNNAFAGILSPSASKNVLTVGAHTNNLGAMQRGSIASFSAHGPTYDGRIKPELTAPGSPVNSARSDGALNSNQCSITSKSGTSMATPFVGGSAVLLREYLQAGYFPSGIKNASAAITPTGALMKALLVHSTVPMGLVEPKATPNGIEGFGRLELDTLFHFADGPATTTKLHFFENVTLQQDESFARCYSYSAAGGELKATLVWMDPPSVAEGAHMSITNDLDLSVADSSGALHFPAGSSSFTRGQVVEQVRVPAASLPTDKKYATVHVHAFTVEQAIDGQGQPFSVVVTGSGLQLEDISKCGGNKCPNDCSGHGKCVNGQCQCTQGYHLVDCSECDAATVCHGNGKCDAATLQCTCNTQVSPTSEHCTTCATGYFGPHCEGTCSCGVHGRCNYDTGVCKCDDTDQKGHWYGEHCNKCAPDFMDTNTGCKSGAFWCANKEVRHIRSSTKGTIMINDWGSYANSQQCGWQIAAEHPSWRVRLVVTYMDIESPYDSLSIYSGESAELGQRIQKLSGKTTGTFVSSGPNMFLKFDADYVGPEKGFTASFEVLRSCTDNMCHGHGHCNEHSSCTCASNFDPVAFCSTCLAGWSGANCDQNAAGGTPAPEGTPVPATPAPPGATPAPAGGSPTPQPAVPVNPCVAADGSMCSSHGQCNSAQTTCNCEKEYVGTQCQVECPIVPINENASPCSGRGECTLDGCHCEHPLRNTGRACQVVEGMLVRLSAESPMERIATDAANRWSFGTYAATALPATTQLQTAVRLVVKTLRPVTSRFPFRLMVWDGVTNVGDMRKTHVSTDEFTNGAICVEMVGWRADSHFGVFDGTTDGNVTGSALVVVEELDPVELSGCVDRICTAKRCTASGPGLVMGQPVVNNTKSGGSGGGKSVKEHIGGLVHDTAVTVKFHPAIATVSAIIGAVVATIILVALRRGCAPTGVKRNSSRYGVVADGDDAVESGDELELRGANEVHPAVMASADQPESPGAKEEHTGVGFEHEL